MDSEHWQPWAWIAIAVFGGVGAALLVHALLYHLFDRIAKKSLTEVDDVLVRHTYSPTRLLLPMLACVASRRPVMLALPPVWVTLCEPRPGLNDVAPSE